MVAHNRQSYKYIIGVPTIVLDMQIIARMKAMMLNVIIPHIEMNGIGRIAIAHASNKQMKAALTGAVFCEAICVVEFSMNMLP
jgi:hypothetical protein